jgi:single-stranded-DNA-specific exonuclease
MSTVRHVFIPNPDPVATKQLQQQLNIHPALAQILVQRGIITFEAAHHFFRPQLTDLHDPFLMKDMDVAIHRITAALERKESILVYGDYDVDGTTAVAVVYSFLQSLHANVGFYIPDRYSEGYGVSTQGIDYAHEKGYSLIIALDCGIKSIDKVAYAKEKNIDFIICDHHLPGDKLPDAVAVLDPKRNDCHYPFKDLCGCGIGFKLIQGLQQHLKLSNEKVLAYLDLVAVSIAADIVPVTGENRVLAYYGLQQLNQHPRAGLKAIGTAAKVKPAADGAFNFTISDLVFVFAPRINAAGRIEHGKAAVTLLTTNDYEEALQRAEGLNEVNRTRRDLDKQITEEALHLLRNDATTANKKSTVVYSEDWHKGVVGIVASRLIENYYRPTIVLTRSNGVVTGSARSVSDFDVYEAIEACSDLLIQFGGHAFAAGLTMAPENVEAFREKFESVVSARIKPHQLVPEIRIDARIAVTAVDGKFFSVLQQMAPFGPGNMNPVFCTDNLTDRGWAKVVGDDHLKCDLTDGSSPGHFISAIGFRQGHHLSKLLRKEPVSVCYTLERNDWNGKSSVQMKLVDMV